MLLQDRVNALFNELINLRTTSDTIEVQLKLVSKLQCFQHRVVRQGLHARYCSAIACDAITDGHNAVA
eukprot:16699-Heterococcus_DN1.PRE.2